MASPSSSGPGASEAGSARPDRASVAAGGTAAVGLLIALAVQNAVPPFATDMYTPAFPKVTTGLGATSTLVGLTLTTFFIGMGTGQVVGGAASDQLGRRRPMIAGALLCMLGAVLCAVAPSIWVLIVARFLQGFGGGVASAVGRAVLVDVAHGDQLARTMSILQAIGGLAPMIAPVLGGILVTSAPWRAIFWALSVFGLVMVTTAWFLVPESLPPERRIRGGWRHTVAGLGSVVRKPVFVGYTFVNALSGFCMFAYISNSAYVLQGQKGLSPIVFSYVFAGNALFSVLLTLVNARLVGRIRPRRLIALGLCLSGLATAVLSIAVFGFGTALIPVCIGFALLIGAQSFVFGNSGALGLDQARGNAGTASAVQGLVQALASATSAPIASSGGDVTAVPMVIVMIIGIVGAWASFLLVGRVQRRRATA